MLSFHTQCLVFCFEKLSRLEHGVKSRHCCLKYSLLLWLACLCPCFVTHTWSCFLNNTLNSQWPSLDLHPHAVSQRPWAGILWLQQGWSPGWRRKHPSWPHWPWNWSPGPSWGWALPTCSAAKPLKACGQLEVWLLIWSLVFISRNEKVKIIGWFPVIVHSSCFWSRWFETITTAKQNLSYGLCKVLWLRFLKELWYLLGHTKMHRPELGVEKIIRCMASNLQKRVRNYPGR